MTHRNQQRSSRWKRIGLAIALAWVAFLAYLLLSADPPDFWFDDIGAVDGPGHLAGGLVTGLVAFLLVARRRWAVALALGGTIGLLLGLEFIQDWFTDRGYETSDVALTVVGAVAGVTGGWVARSIVQRLRARTSSTSEVS